MTGDTVLVVDDEGDILDTYSTWLSDEYEVRTASGGEEALEKLDGEVSVVLLDRRMPDMLGREVLGEIRDRDTDPRVAMVTAVSPDFDVLGMGFDAYLVKPVKRDDLLRTVEGLTGQKDYVEKITEYHSLVSRKVVLEQEMSDERLAGNERYRDLLDEIESMKDEVDALSDGMSPDDFESVVRDIHDRA